MNSNEVRGQRVATALQACPVLSRPSASRDALWFAVQESICTRGLCLVNPLGSASFIPVTPDHATDELLAAMDWLIKHESEARGMPPLAVWGCPRPVGRGPRSRAAWALRAATPHKLWARRSVHWRNRSPRQSQGRLSPRRPRRRAGQSPLPRL